MVRNMLSGKKRKWNASTVVEMAYLMPMIFLVWILVIFTLFYYHDKNILAGAAYETAVLGTELYHEKGEIGQGTLENYFQTRVKRKLLFFGGAAVEVQTGDTEIRVRAEAFSRRMRLKAEQSAAVTVPEKTIRRLDAVKRRMAEAEGK